ncbi:MAG: hypothetical protein ACXVBE_00165 [Bdellovibrionota bacterium]
MKTIFISAVLFLSATAGHAATIVLSPGSQITIRSGEDATVSCSGSAMVGKCKCIADGSGRYWITYYKNGSFYGGGDGRTQLAYCEIQMATYSECQ